jgi:hypothetical protein
VDNEKFREKIIGDQASNWVCMMGKVVPVVSPNGPQVFVFRKETRHKDTYRLFNRNISILLWWITVLELANTKPLCTFLLLNSSWAHSNGDIRICHSRFERILCKLVCLLCRVISSHWAADSTTWVWFLAGQYFYFRRNVKMGCGASIASVTWCYFLEGKVARAWTWPWSPSNAEVKNVCGVVHPLSYTSARRGAETL